MDDKYISVSHWGYFPSSSDNQVVKSTHAFTPMEHHPDWFRPKESAVDEFHRRFGIDAYRRAQGL